MGVIFAKIGITVLFTCLKTFILVIKMRNSKARRGSIFSETFFFEVSYKSANTSLEEIIKIKVHVIFILRQVMFR